MYNTQDPRFRRTLNRLSHSLESANTSAQAGLWSAREHCLVPCLASFSTCLGSVDGCMRAATARCFPVSAESARVRRHRGGGSRWVPEQSFDFYDDWEGEEEIEGLLGSEQPRRQRGMSYGSRGREEDPTVIPNQSAFGFLGRFPFNMGGKGLRYTPSAAGLKERHQGRERRKRSATAVSEESESSRGDIFPSDEEDAVALDDEFDVILARKTSADDGSSGRTRRSSKRTVSSAGSRSGEVGQAEGEAVPSLADLRHEEAKVAAEEEGEVEKKREAALRLAYERGLSKGMDEGEGGDEGAKVKAPPLASPGSRTGSLEQASETYPFPNLDSTPESPVETKPGSDAHGSDIHQASRLDESQQGG